ncbi:MAG: glycosyltransferase family 39 protein [Parvularculaceae bacterium]
MTDFLVKYRAPLLLALIYVLAVAIYWHGAGPGDAEQYYRTALAWANDGPQLGKDHWGLRQLFVLPMAAAFTLLGQNEFAATVPNILYGAALVALTWHFGRRFMGQSSAFALTAFVALSAFFVARPIEVDVYGPEIVFSAMSCWLFVGSQLERHWRPWLAAAGIAAGLAFTIREQAAAVGIGFGFLILSSRRQIIERGAILAAGFLSVIAAEMVAYWIASGDPLYRYLTDLNHTKVSSGKAATVEQIGLWGVFIRAFKDFLTFPNSVPFAAIAAAGAFYFRRDISKWPHALKRTLIVFAVSGAVTAAISSYAFNLSMPRYYPLLTYFIFIVLGALCAEIYARFGRLAGWAFALLVIAGNIAAADFSRYNEYAEARLLANLAMKSDETIYTDGATALRARYEMIFLGADRNSAASKIVSVPQPEEGVLYYRTWENRAKNTSGCVLLAERPRAPNWTHWLLRVTGFSSIVGGDIKRVTEPPVPVELIRIGGDENGPGCLTKPNPNSN